MHLGVAHFFGQRVEQERPQGAPPGPTPPRPYNERISLILIVVIVRARVELLAGALEVSRRKNVNHTQPDQPS